MENGVQSFCVVPLTTAFRRWGAWDSAACSERVYSQDDEVDFMQQVARQVAVAVDNVLHVTERSVRPAAIDSRARPHAACCWK